MFNVCSMYVQCICTLDFLEFHIKTRTTRNYKSTSQPFECVSGLNNVQDCLIFILSWGHTIKAASGSHYSEINQSIKWRYDSCCFLANKTLNLVSWGWYIKWSVIWKRNLWSFSFGNVQILQGLSANKVWWNGFN